MNNIITPGRNQLTTFNASNLLFISQVGEPFQSWNPEKYVKAWLQKGKRAAYTITCMQRARKTYSSCNNDYYQSIWNIFT